MPIKNKEDYIRYLETDRRNFGISTYLPILSNNIMKLLTHPCWKFQKLLRKLEYYNNCLNYLNYIPYIIYLKYKFLRMSIDLGLTIPINVFGEGLVIGHFGSIIVSRHAQIDKNCTLILA